MLVFMDLKEIPFIPRLQVPSATKLPVIAPIYSTSVTGGTRWQMLGGRSFSSPQETINSGRLAKDDEIFWPIGGESSLW